MKKVLVTGATGFIGEHVVEALLEKGFHVIATSKNEDKARLRPWFNSVKYVAFDLQQFDASTNYFEYFGSPDFMLHLAWEGLPNYKNEFHITENLPKHFAFLKNMIQHGLKDLSVSGTCFEYGMQEGRLIETMECFPDNPYAIAKNKLRLALEALSKENNFNFKWVRFFYMYGSGQNPKSLIAQLDKALENNDASFNMSGGEQIRDFLPVNLIANYFIQIATQNEIQGIINCCSGQPISVKYFVVNYLRLKNKNIELNLGYYPYADYEPMQFWGDDTKLKKIIS
jgi:nucleoside-diphosphate-sugar epimerase